MQNEPNSPPRRFRVALSFPGEKRTFVRSVAEHLALNLGSERVLYDEYYESEFARPDLDIYLQSLYHNDADLIAVFLCNDYERKEWPGLEWRAIRDLIKKRQASTVMPLRFDDTEVPGLFSIDGYVWIGERSPQTIADVIIRRLDNKHANPSSTLEDDRVRMNQNNPIVDVQSLSKEAHASINVHGDNNNSIANVGGNVTIGLGLREVEELLKSQARSLTESLISARESSSAEVVRKLEIELHVVQEKLKDTTKTLHERESSLSDALKVITVLESKLPTENLKNAREYLAAGNTSKAEVLLRQIVEIEGESLSDAYFILGRLAETRFDFDSALNYYRKAASGSRNWEYLIAAGKINFLAGNDVEASTWLNESLATAVHLNDAAKLSVSYNELGLVHERQEKFTLAEEEYNKALTFSIQAFGSHHREVAIRYSNLAGLLSKHSKEASDIYEKAIAITQELPEDDLFEQIVTSNYAGYFYNRGDNTKAEELFKKAINKTIEKTKNNEHILIAIALNGLGEIYIEQSRYMEAEDVLNRSLKLFINAVGPGSEDTANAYNNVAKLRRRQGLMSHCIELNKHALQIRERLFGQMHLSVANSLNNLANAYCETGNFELALNSANRARVIREALLGSTHTLLANTLNILGIIHLKTEKYSEAIDFFTRSIAIKEINLGGGHIQLFPAVNNLALAYLDEGRYNESEITAKRAQNITLEYYKSPTLEAATSFNTLGLIYAATHRSSEARQHFSKALEIARKFLPLSHPTIQKILASLSNLKY